MKLFLTRRMVPQEIHSQRQQDVISILKLHDIKTVNVIPSLEYIRIIDYLVGPFTTIFIVTHETLNLSRLR